MKRLPILIVLMVVVVVLAIVLITGHDQNPASQSKVTVLANYSIQPLESDPCILIVDLKGGHSIANIQFALNDISTNDGKIKDITSCSFHYSYGNYCNPTTHLFVRIEPFNPPRTMVGPTPYPEPDAPSRAGAK